jgi:hypothetical protein
MHTRLLSKQRKYRIFERRLIKPGHPVAVRLYPLV